MRISDWSSDVCSSDLLASAVDSKLPGDTNLVGTVVGVVKNTGVALVQTGNGQQYLVDGLTAAPGQLVTATIGKATAPGPPGASPPIGASILSPGQQNGSLLNVGVGVGRSEERRVGKKGVSR